MILHIAKREEWRSAVDSGQYLPATPAASAFIHCSTGRQIRGPWRELFAGAEDLALLLIDEREIGAAVLYEAMADGEDLFPHAYGPIPVTAVVAAEPLVQGHATAVGLPPRIARLIAAARGNGPPGIDEWRHLHYIVSTDPARLDRGRIHDYLCGEAYWSRGVPREVMETAFANSLCFGVYAPDGKQAGLCRVVTDQATYAYLCDVFVLPEHRGLGLGVWAVRCSIEHPDLAGVRSWQLATRDAQGVYERFGWKAADPARWMSRAIDAADLY